MIPEPTFPLSDLGVWIRFAVSKGGLATAVALVDTLAVNQDQLMFLAEDDVIILYVFADGLSYLGYCEGVVGKLAKSSVKLKSKLKRIVLAPRSPRGSPQQLQDISSTMVEDVGSTLAPSSTNVDEINPDYHLTPYFDSSSESTTPSPQLLTHSRFASARSVSTGTSSSSLVTTDDDGLNSSAFPLPLPLRNRGEDATRHTSPVQRNPASSPRPPATPPRSSSRMAAVLLLKEAQEASSPSSPSVPIHPAQYKLDHPIAQHHEQPRQERQMPSSPSPPKRRTPVNLDLTLSRPQQYKINVQQATPFSTLSPLDESFSSISNPSYSTDSGSETDRRPSILSNDSTATVVALPSTPKSRTSAEGWVTPPLLELKEVAGEEEDEERELPNLSHWSPKSPKSPAGLSNFFGMGRKKPKTLPIVPSLNRYQVESQPNRPRQGSLSKSANAAATDSDFAPAVAQLPTSRSLDYGRREDDYTGAGKFNLEYSKSLDHRDHRRPSPFDLRATGRSGIDQRIQLASEDPSSPLRASFTDSPEVEMGSRYLPSAGDNAGDTQVNEIAWLTALDSIAPRMVRGDKKLRALVRMGIADRLRGRVWRYLTDAKSDFVDGLYQKLCKLPRLPIYEAIEKDLETTFNDHPYFAVASKPRFDLLNVLKPFAQYDPTLGYCPGLGYIIGAILHQSESPTAAEDAFYILIALVKRYGFHRYFSQPNDAKTNRVEAVDAMILSQLLEMNDKKLGKKLTELNVDPTKSVLSWSTTTLLPWNTTLRLLDLFFFDPDYHYLIALSLIRLSKPFVETKRSKTQAEVLDFFLHFPSESVAAETLVGAVAAVSIKEEKLNKMKTKAELMIPKKLN